MVVGLNERKLIEQSFPRLTFCEEIFYFDLGSKDDSISFAKEFGAITQAHQLVPFGEVVISNKYQLPKNDWLFITDPDELVTEELADFLLTNFNEISNDPLIGSFSAPIIFFFKKHRLKGTPWGWQNERIILANREKFEFRPRVHSGRVLKAGFINYKINGVPNAEVLHLWSSGWISLFRKHFRYLRKEGTDRLYAGQRTSIKEIVISPAKEFYISFFRKKGYLDGLTGFGLSVFWAWYQTAALTKLFIVQKRP